MFVSVAGDDVYLFLILFSSIFSFLCAQAVSVETMSLYWTDEEAAIIAKATYSINT